MLAAPTASPPRMRKKTNSADPLEAPDPRALTVKAKAVRMSTGRRPNLSARFPAKKAPTALPKRIDATLNPVPASLELNSVCNASTVQLITPLSNPKRNPPNAATKEKKRIAVKFPFPPPEAFVSSSSSSSPASDISRRCSVKRVGRGGRIRENVHRDIVAQSGKKHCVFCSHVCSSDVTRLASD